MTQTQMKATATGGFGSTLGKTLAELRANTHSCAADDTIAYGSFTAQQPSEKDHDMQMKCPRKIMVRDPQDSLMFKQPFYYLTLETTEGVRIAIQANSKQEQPQTRKRMPLAKQKDGRDREHEATQRGSSPINPKYNTLEPGASCKLGDA